MIKEILTYITEQPRLKEAKRFGHLAESISLLSREERCQKAWLPHRTECKNFISANLHYAIHFDSILILGSGPLHEIPIEFIAKKFRRVVLVDIVHLKNTKKSVAHLTNIEFIEHDITEIEQNLFIEKKLIEKTPTAFLKENWGMVLSVNMMSQLPLHLGTWIEKKLKNKFSSVLIKNYLEAVTRNHFEYLKSFHAPVILITDTEATYRDKGDNIIQTDHNYTHLKLPGALAEWNWNVAPIPEFQKDIGIVMRVCGFVIK